MKHLRYSLLVLSVLGLGACEQTFEGLKQDLGSINLPKSTASSVSGNEADRFVASGACPQAEIVGELQSLSEFDSASNPAPSNLISTIEITNVQKSCNYASGAATIDLKMDFVGTLGPRGRALSSDRPFFSYPFFVAVTSRDGTILAKEVFAASLTYDPGQNTKIYTEKLRQIIPIERGESGGDYRVLVGFQLTPDQLAHNRQKIREDRLMEQARAQAPTEFEETAQDAQQQAAQNTNRPIVISP